MRYLASIRYIDAVVKAGSIRAAADTLAITSTALNRRILAMEEELGVPIFERLPHGVRLSAAGEIYIHHIRNQLSDMERVRSADRRPLGREANADTCRSPAARRSCPISCRARSRSIGRNIRM